MNFSKECTGLTPIQPSPKQPMVNYRYSPSRSNAVCGYFGTTRRGWQGGKASSLCIVEDRRRDRSECTNIVRVHLTPDGRLLTAIRILRFPLSFFLYAPMNFVLRRKNSCLRSPSSTLEALIAEGNVQTTNRDWGNLYNSILNGGKTDGQAKYKIDEGHKMKWLNHPVIGNCITPTSWTIVHSTTQQVKLLAHVRYGRVRVRLTEWESESSFAIQMELLTPSAPRRARVLSRIQDNSPESGKKHEWSEIKTTRELEWASFYGSPFDKLVERPSLSSPRRTMDKQQLNSAIVNLSSV